MQPLYYTNPANFGPDIVEKIYETLCDKFKSKEDLDIAAIFEDIPLILKDLQIPTEYFDMYLHQFIYETTFDIYHDATIALKMNSSETTNMRKCITSRYPEITNAASSKEIKISSEKNSLLSFAKTLIDKNDNRDTFANANAITYSAQKGLHFYSFFYSFLPDGKKNFVSYLTEKDLIFNLENYKNFIYNPKNINNGIQFYNYFTMVQDFLNFHKRPHNLPSFDDEYSAFLFEQLHYPIQFQKCIVSYMTQDFSSENIPKSYFPMLLYTKLFDTHYLSLTDYILKKYNVTPINYSSSENRTFTKNDISISNWFYKLDKQAEDLRYYSFYEMQFYNSILLPLLTYVIKKVLFALSKEDILKIKTLSYEYLHKTLDYDVTRIKNRSISFYTQLTRIYKKVTTCNYSGYKNIPLTQTRLKNTDLEYLFNHHFSLAFFTQDVPNYFGISHIHNLRIPSLKPLCQDIAAYYSMWEHTFRDDTLESRRLKEKTSLFINTP